MIAKLTSKAPPLWGSAIIDGPTDIIVDAIVPGSITIKNTILSALTPAVSADLGFSFITHGQLGAHSSVSVALPNHGWLLPRSLAGSVKIASSGRLLALSGIEINPNTIKFVLHNVSVPERTELFIEVKGVTTPSSARGVAQYTVNTNTAMGSMIDNATGTLPAIVSGALSGSLTLAPVSRNSPGVTGQIRVEFTLSGAVPAGGFVRVTFPPDWNLPVVPSVTVLPLSVGVTGFGTWSNSTRELLVQTSGRALAQGSSLALLIDGVKTPPSVRKIATANISTLDTAAAGKL